MSGIILVSLLWAATYTMPAPVIIEKSTATIIWENIETLSKEEQIIEIEKELDKDYDDKIKAILWNKRKVLKTKGRGCINLKLNPYKEEIK